VFISRQIKQSAAEHIFSLGGGARYDVHHAAQSFCLMVSMVLCLMVLLVRRQRMHISSSKTMLKHTHMMKTFIISAQHPSSKR
jgi:hypothetical protein